MKILVLDDSVAHRKSAVVTLQGHTVTVVGTYDEAYDALTTRTNQTVVERIAAELLPQAGFQPNDFVWKFKDDPERQKRCEEVWDQAHERATYHPDFDVVLLDLFVPASRRTMGNEGMKFVGQERELGALLALRALAAGIKYVAVVTDMNHHHHPAAAAFDDFGSFKGEGFKLLCENYPDFVKLDQATNEIVSMEFIKSDAGKAKYPSQHKSAAEYGQEYGPWQGILVGKDWGNILERLLSL